MSRRRENRTPPVRRSIVPDGQDSPVIRKQDFQKMVRQTYEKIVTENPDLEGMTFRGSTIAALQTAAEAYLTARFEDNKNAQGVCDQLAIV